MGRFTRAYPRSVDSSTERNQLCHLFSASVITRFPLWIRPLNVPALAQSGGEKTKPKESNS